MKIGDSTVYTRQGDRIITPLCDSLVLRYKTPNYQIWHKPFFQKWTGFRGPRITEKCYLLLVKIVDDRAEVIRIEYPKSGKFTEVLAELKRATNRLEYGFDLNELLDTI